MDLHWGPMPGDSFGELMVEGEMSGGIVVFPIGNTHPRPTSPWRPAQ